MKKIVFGITNLSIGGAEKTLVDLSNTLCDKYDITILTLYGQGELEKKLSPNIKIINLYKNAFEKINSIKKFLISLRLLFMKKNIYKKYIKNKFDIEIAFLEGPITNLFSVKNKQTKKIAWIHTNISLIFGNNLKAKIKKIINKKIYNKYDNLVFISQSALDNFNNTFNINVEKHVINNYININNILELSNEEIDFKYDKNTINFLSVCRLVKPKAINRLIKIHSKLLAEGYYHKFYIIGDGPEKENLKNMIKKLNVENTFFLLGEKKNPYPYIKKCDHFCLLSYYEGYGIVVEEAKALQKQIIITNTASKEALTDYENKIILENNENDIYTGLKNIILNNKNENNNNLIKYEFNNDSILKKIMEILGD